MQPPFTLLPATCELCGSWLPEHQETCPRNGVHPSQWTMKMLIVDNIEQEENESDQED